MNSTSASARRRFRRAATRRFRRAATPSISAHGDTVDFGDPGDPGDPSARRFRRARHRHHSPLGCPEPSPPQMEPAEGLEPTTY